MSNCASKYRWVQIFNPHLDREPVFNFGLFLSVPFVSLLRGWGDLDDEVEDEELLEDPEDEDDPDDDEEDELEDEELELEDLLSRRLSSSFFVGRALQMNSTIKNSNQ